MITTEETKEIMTSFGRNPQDSGSPEVQIALLSKRIENLNPHFMKNKHDFHSKQGLMKMIGRRRRLLRYLNQENPERYQEVIKKLGLRK